MIITEYLKNDTLIKHYSDEGYMLLQNETGLKYADPVDCIPCKYTYTETDEPIEIIEENEENLDEATIEDYQGALSEFGVEI